MHNNSREDLPLAGLTVVELATVVFAPFTTRMLADMGADVIKIENGKTGDAMRHAGRTPVPGMGAIFVANDRNKRSIRLDLTEQRDQRVIHKLLAKADMFVTNVRAKGLTKLGLDYAAIGDKYRQLIYVHCVGFGSAGTYAGRPAYDDLIQAASGMTDLHARASADGIPKYTPSLIADKTAGLYAAIAGLAALHQRTRTGNGGFIEIPMFEAVTDFNLLENLFGMTFVPPVGRPAYNRAITKYRKPHKTLDGYISIVPYSDEQFARFFEIIGKPGILENDPRFADYKSRTANIGLLYAMITEAAKTKTTAQWLEILGREDIPAMKVNTLEEVLDDPHLQSLDFIKQCESDNVGQYKYTLPPFTFNGKPLNLYRDPPLLDQHRQEILQELGISDSNTA